MARMMLVGLLLSGGGLLQAQSPGRYEVSFLGMAQHSNRANTAQSATMAGASATFAADLHQGWGFAVGFSGANTDSVGQTGVPLTLTTLGAGPYFRTGTHRTSVYGDLLFGYARGSDSVFPGPTTVSATATSYSIQANGGFDLNLKHHTAWRVVEFGWLHTALPNGTNNNQDNFHLGSGLVFRFGH